MALIIPKHYQQRLLPETTEVAIKTIKDSFQKKLSAALHLRRVTAPLFVLAGTGVNDDLNGTEHPVAFTIDAMGGKRAEVVHSLAKWKRIKLGAYGIAPGYGIYTDMNAIRTFEDLDNMHSLYVDQWDWEKKYIFSHSNDSLGVFHTPGQRRLHYYAAPCLDNIWKDFDVVKKRRCYNHNIHIGTRQKILQVPIAFIYMVAFGIAQGLGVAVIGNSFEGKIFVLCQGITMVIGR